MQKRFRVKRCSVKLRDLTGNGLLKWKTMPYCNTMRKTQSIILTLSCSVEVSRIETTSVQATVEVPLKHECDATWFEPVRSSFCESLVRSYFSSSDSLSVVTVTRSDLLAIWGLPNNPARFLVTSSWHLQSSFASAQENISSVWKAEFYFDWRELILAAFYFACFFFPAGTKFCRSRSIHKIRKKLIRTCKILMLHRSQAFGL